MKNTKSIYSFIKKHRSELDELITKALTRYDPPSFNRNIRLNDEERRRWVLNDEGLYNWSKSEGVKI